MKNYENFDNLFFVKIICIIAALALVFVIAIAAIGLFTGDYSVASKDSDAETFVFGDTTDTSSVSATESKSDSEPAGTDAETLPPETAPSTEADTQPQDSTSDIEVAPIEPAPTILEETEDMGDEYINSLIFLGDSTSYGLKAYSMLREGKETKQVWTSKNATVSLNEILTKMIVYPETGKEMLIADAAALAKPEYLVITLGVEGITSLDEESFKAQYKSLVEAIQTASPETKVILQSIFPVSAELKKLNNELIDNGNLWVKAIAEQTGVRYLDTASVLKDENGALNPKYDNGGNGINLNDSGFNAVLGYIRTHGYK